MIKKNFWLVLSAAVTAAVLLHNNTSSAEAQMAPSRMTEAQQPSKDAFIRYVFEELSGNPPAAEVWKEIQDGTVLVRWGADGAAGGAFGIREGRETLLFNERNVLRAMESKEETLKQMASIVHESVHHRQYHERNGASEMLSCVDWWIGEREAYTKECEFADSIGFTGLSRKCSTDRPEMFRRRLLGTLLRYDPHGIKCRGEASRLDAIL